MHTYQCVAFFIAPRIYRCFVNRLNGYESEHVFGKNVAIISLERYVIQDLVHYN